MAAIVALDELVNLSVSARSYAFRYGRKKQTVYLRIDNALCRMGLEEDTQRLVLRFDGAERLTALAKRYSGLPAFDKADVAAPLTEDGELVVYITERCKVFDRRGRETTVQEADLYRRGFTCHVLLRLDSLSKGEAGSVYLRKFLHQVRVLRTAGVQLSSK